MFENLQDTIIASRHQRTTCTVGLLLADLGDKDREGLTAALDNADIKTVEIAQVLQSKGYPIQAGTLGRHRQRADGAGCRCPL